MEKIVSVISAFISFAVGSLTNLQYGQPIVAPTPTPKIEYYQAKGEINRYPYVVRYVLWIPKDGGDVNGDIKGYLLGKDEQCSAKVQGVYDGGEGGKIDGIVDGKCNIFIFDQSIEGHLEGKVYPQKRYVEAVISGKVGDNSFQEYVYSSFY